MTQQKSSILPEADAKLLIRQLKAHEGENRDASGRHTPYRCRAGALTVGYGHNLNANPIPGFDPLHGSLTEAEAEELLRQDITLAEIDIYCRVPVYRLLDHERRAVLVNMVFNLGIFRFMGFKRMIAALEQGDYARAAAEMLNSKWADDVGYRAGQLAEQMRYGEWVF